MTTITNAARTAAISRILKDAFDARQADLHARMDAEIGAIAKAKWPRFYELRADESARHFVPAAQRFNIEYGDRICVQLVKIWYEFAFDGWLASAETTTIETPAHISGDELPRLPEDCSIVDDYWAYRDELTEARGKLVAAFSAYESREKMEADLPDLARYLPQPVVTGNSVSVKPTDIMEGLAKLGIPPKVAA
jgi:hypothetical protein